MKMKNITLLLVALLSWAIIPCFAQQTYYYHKGFKVPLAYSTQKIYVKFKGDASLTNKRNILSTLSSSKKIDTTAIHDPLNFVIIELLETTNKYEFQNILYNLNTNENAVVALPFLQFSDTTSLVGITEMFFVKLHVPEDYGILERLAKETHTNIVRQNEFVQGLYEIEADKNAKGNALEMANYFFEKGNFKYSTPDFIYRIQKNCATDPLFNEQWGLKNTGLNGGVAGVDLNICDAWNITKGCSNIKIAVLDNGVDLNHPDLIENLLPGYDAVGYSGGGCGTDEHGTACAGIIAAKSNNIGISGVAPECKIIPIHTYFNTWDPYGTSLRMANTINWAWQNGADILSNSWSFSYEQQDDLVDDAIDLATTSGRNGLGCVIVCASGNDNTMVQYPACYPKTIAVGAIDRCGIRAGKYNITGSCDPWDSSLGSCYGTGLDVVAPGTNIYTTDISGSVGNNAGDYISNFGGTSAACPFVAGVAALVLSVNPNLTYEQVRKYIDIGCDKVSEGVNYSYNYSEKYGIWNYQLGYGKVNAFKTLQYVLGSERTMNNLSGTITNTTNTYKWELINPIDGLAAGVYFVKRYEIKTNINYSENETIIATSDGLSPDNPNFGNPYTKITYLSGTSATLTSYVYELYNVLGQQMGYKPVSPSNFKFHVRLFKKLEKDLYLNNVTILDQVIKYEATNHIETQNVTISGNSIVNFHAGNTIVWEDGTTISPTGNGIVNAYIEPFILGECDPSYLLSAQNDLSTNIILDELEIEEEYTSVDIFSDVNFKLYPNPNSGAFQIETNFPLSDIGNLKIVNLLGIPVYKTQNVTSNTFQLPASTSGQHFVVMVLKDGTVLTQKMMIQR